MKKWFFTSLLLIGLSFLACNGPDDSNSQSTYVVKSLANSFVTWTPDEGTKSFSFDSVPEGETTNLSEVFLYVFADELEYVVAQSSRNNWCSAAYADIAPPSAQYLLNYIKVTSDKPLYTENKTYEPGDDLEAEFRFTESFYDEFQSLYQYLQWLESRQERYHVDTYLQFIGVLTQPLDQTFTVTYSFADNSIVSTTTSKILAK